MTRKLEKIQDLGFFIIYNYYIYYPFSMKLPSKMQQLKTDFMFLTKILSVHSQTTVISKLKFIHTNYFAFKSGNNNFSIKRVHCICLLIYGYYCFRVYQ